jgi:hypothetical protein
MRSQRDLVKASLSFESGTDRHNVYPVRKVEYPGATVARLVADFSDPRSIVVDAR